MGCENNDDSDFELSAKVLQQTVWSGSYITYEDEEEVFSDKAALFFVSDTRVDCTVQYDSTIDRRKFEYRVNGNVLTIIQDEGVGTQLSGDWLVQKKTKDSLVLILYPGTAKYFVLELKRRYE